MKRVILHCDLNNFYASVECLYHPELRDKPVAVCGSIEDRHGIVLAKTMRQKIQSKNGRDGMGGKKQVPGLVVVKANHLCITSFQNMPAKFTNITPTEWNPLDWTNAGLMSVKVHCFLETGRR